MTVKKNYPICLPAPSFHIQTGPPHFSTPLPSFSSSGMFNACCYGYLPQNACCCNSQVWQSVPMYPGGQPQDPLCLSQAPPFSQAGQVSLQPGPQKPSGHTEEEKLSYCWKTVSLCSTLTSMHAHSQFSQCSPCVPAWQWHCPVSLSHGAPVQLHGWMQPGPNIPSGHSDTQHTHTEWTFFQFRIRIIILCLCLLLSSTLLTFLPMTPSGAFSLARSSHMITGLSRRTGAPLLTAESKSTSFAAWTQKRAHTSLIA